MKSKPARRAAPSSFDLRLPATSANLGPAFDAAALAFESFLTIRARPAKEFSITARGRDAEICGKLEKHLILTTYREVLQSEGRPAPPLQLRIFNQIAIGKGCGSSAAARLAGIALAVHFGSLRWSDSRIVGEAARREGHPDNAAACWMGGLAISRMSGEAEAQVVQIQTKGKWSLLLAVPPSRLSTESARGVLPAHYSRADAVANIQNSMLLLAAFALGRPDLLAWALEDRIHQPYRAPLCPLLPALQRLAGQFGILGVALSGAGPSVLVFVEPKTDLKRTCAAVRDHLREEGLSAELIPTAITQRGARDGFAGENRRRSRSG